jgi:threonine dehydrogenase-like Zn-dependent dehydrogenase
MKVEPVPKPASLLVCSQRTLTTIELSLSLTTGHENMGIVEELGAGVTLLKKGDRVVMPFNVADGRCRNCEEGKTAFCTGVNPGFAGGAYGYVAMGPYRGG